MWVIKSYLIIVENHFWNESSNIFHLKKFLDIDINASAKHSKKAQNNQRKKLGSKSNPSPQKFPKFIGKHVCNDLIKYKGYENTKELRELLKDKLSWEKINKGLKGTFKIGSGEESASSFSELLTFEFELLEKSNLESQSLKDFYRVIIINFQNALKSLKSQGLSHFGCKIIKGWPSVEIDKNQVSKS